MGIIINWLNILSFILTAVGLFISFLSYIKIRNVRKAQQEYKNNIDLDNVLSTLNKTSNLLSELQSDSTAGFGPNGYVLQKIYRTEMDIYKTIGYVESANNIMLHNQQTKIPLPIYYGQGYHSTDFFNNIILKAKHELIICCWWNASIFRRVTIDVMIKLNRECNCKITVMGFSTDMEEEILTELRKCIHHAPEIDQLKKSQESGRRLFLEEKAKYGIKDFKYYESLEYIPFHCTWVDEKFYWGLINYHRVDDLDSYDGAYLEFDRKSNFSVKMLDKYNELRMKAKEY